ncbi:MAG: hypothetical protein GTO41_25290 [Burkholderiales bacterium]|nr:hypothetical protein [Burkholderiales bacterium]
MKWLAGLTWIAMLGLLVACASSPNVADDNISSNSERATRADRDTALKAATHAKDMVGQPYRYGGNTPRGFDCSGLVHYSYARVGVDVPRTTRAQLSAGIPVTARSLREGDLVFFNQEGKKFSHVGIYIGGGRFVHAPSSGKRVRVDRLDKRYWRQHFAAARRI